MLTINKLEKHLNKKLEDFECIVLAVKVKEKEDKYPYAYNFAYMFENKETYWWQLQSTEISNDGKVLDNKNKINSRFSYINKLGYKFEETLIGDHMFGTDTLIVKFNKR